MFFCVHFFACTKKRTKESTACSLAVSLLAFGYPVLLKKAGRCETRPPEADSNSPRAIPSFSVLLGCVKWQQTKTYLLFILCANPF